MTCIFPSNESTLGTWQMFWRRIAKIIFASIVFSTTYPYWILQRAHSGFIPYDILNACFAISVVTSVNPSNVIILLSISCTKYFAHFSFLSTWYASNAWAKRLVFSSNYSRLVSETGIKARPEFMYATFPTITLAGNIMFIFFWRRKEYLF